LGETIVIFDALRSWLDKTLAPWFAEKGIMAPAYTLEEPPAGIDGDVACNIAMLLAKPLRQPPRTIAREIQDIVNRIEGPLLFEHALVAGAGFLNFTWTQATLTGEVARLLASPEHYGRLPGPPKQKWLIEFVSANPTGPLHVGHGRGAALGDSLALILAHLGYVVSREYYINDAGNQVQLLGESVLARAKELAGEPFQMPEEGYQGDYIKDVAKDYVAKFPNPSERSVEQATAFALEQLLAAIRHDLEDFGVRFDSWFSEASLVKKGAVEKHIAQLKARGHVEESEGALWFVAPGEESEARDKNRVLKRRDGRWTYFATDIAYHADKCERGFDKLVDLWGADHHGYVARVTGSLKALGYDANRLHVILYQLVSLTRNGVPVSMSKRSGDFITLREVLKEVGRDACRFFFAMRGPNTAFDFDLELAKKQTVDNPVYYLQYAHARIGSIFRQAGAAGNGSDGDLNILKEKEERELMKRLVAFPVVLRACAQENSPHPLATYLLQLARQFHHFYDHHRVLGEDAALTQARLRILRAVRDLLRLGLHLLGVSAPESM
jgi:arginyl-tRNA synthetase